MLFFSFSLRNETVFCHLSMKINTNRPPPPVDAVNAVSEGIGSAHGQTDLTALPLTLDPTVSYIITLSYIVCVFIQNDRNCVRGEG